jgi:putative ABC transport system substrate-binding protein
MEYRFAELKSEHMTELAADLVRWKADVIVMASVGPGVGQVQGGLAESLEKPGENVTGLSFLRPELITKRLEIIEEVVPKLTRSVLMRAGSGAGSGQQQMEEIRAAASSLKLTLVELPSELDPDVLERTFKVASEKQVNAIIPTASRQTLGARKPITELAIKYRVPAIYQEQELADAGGLMSYGPDFSDLYQCAAIYVDKILKGTKPQNREADRPDDSVERLGAG